MKKILLTTYLLLFSFLLAVAAPVDEQSARKIAGDFFYSNKSGLTRAAVNDGLVRAFTGVADGNDAGIYVFNMDKGFVVVSANDELPAVLAYGLGNSYDAKTAPDAMKVLLKAYHDAATIKGVTRATVSTHPDIAPMTTTKWDQNAPYNMYCPEEDGVKCPTGCVATAMAQLMYYYRWPESFNWDAMNKQYAETEEGAAAETVAKLMADVGKSVGMDYAPDTSGASEYDAVEAFRNTYNYAHTTELVERSCYTASTWDELMYNELKAKRPIFYAAVSVSSAKGPAGHAFVIDGYQAKAGVGYYHVNWGWGGFSDNYFLISVLNSREEYTGGNAGSSGYSIDQSAIIGFDKGKVGTETSTRFAIKSVEIPGDKGVYTRSSTSLNFPELQLQFSCFNVTLPAEARHYDLAYALYQDRELVKMIDSVSFKDIIAGGAPMDFGMGFSKFTTGSFAIGKGLADGTYQLRLLSRETGKKQWQWAMLAACRYVELTIDGRNMTTTTYGQYSDPYVSSFKINSVKVSENCEVGKPITITVNVTDRNSVSNAPLYLYGNASLALGEDQFQLLTGCGTNLDAGQTGDVVLEYTPQRAGKFVFYLSGDPEELTDSLYRFEVNVSGFALVMDMEVENAKSTSSGMNEVPGTSFKGTLHFSNYGSLAYDKGVNLSFYGGASVNTMESLGSKKEALGLQIGESKDIAFSYDNLTVGNYYMLLVTAFDGENAKPLNYEDAGDGYIRFYYNVIYLLTQDTAIKDIMFDTEDAIVYDMRGVRVGKASDLKSLPKGIYIINKKKVVNR